MYHVAKIKQTELDMIYKVMMIRIAKNCSAERLSLMIGRPKEYIESVEMLYSLPYSKQELRKIATALDEHGFMFWLGGTGDNTPMFIQMDTVVMGDKYIHVCSEITGAETRAMQFILKEDILRPSECKNQYTI